MVDELKMLIVEDITFGVAVLRSGGNNNNRRSSSASLFTDFSCGTPGLNLPISFSFPLIA